MSSSPCSCCTERPPGVSGPRRASKRPDEAGWRRMVRRREHSEPVTRLQGGSSALVRRCRDFYAQRLRQSELLRNKWAIRCNACGAIAARQRNGGLCRKTTTRRLRRTAKPRPLGVGPGLTWLWTRSARKS
ncbi:hypothetical protein MRX96_030599 [Rhipicephalus microplus]